MNETDIYEGQEKLYTLHDQVLQAGFVDFKKEPSEYLEAPVKKPKKKQRSRAKGAPKAEPRTLNPEKWKKNVIKKARLTGQSYVNYSGEVVPAKTMGPPCKCPRKCFNENRKAIFEGIFQQFYEMKSKDIQDTYLCGLIHSYDIQRHRSKDGSRPPRTTSFKYYLKCPNAFFQVCKKTFCSVHAITSSRVERLANSLKNNIVAPEDMRGRHSTKPQLQSPEIIAQVDSHIRRFIVPGQKWMPKHLCIKKMHGLYLQEYEWNLMEDLKKGIETKPIVSLNFYQKHYKKHFNLPFGEPKK